MKYILIVLVMTFSALNADSSSDAKLEALDEKIAIIDKDNKVLDRIGKAMGLSK